MKSASRSTRSVQLARKYPNTHKRFGTPVNIAPRASSEEPAASRETSDIETVEAPGTE